MDCRCRAVAAWRPADFRFDPELPRLAPDRRPAACRGAAAAGQRRRCVQWQRCGARL